MNVDFYTAAVDCAYLCVRVLEKPKEHTGQQQKLSARIIVEFQRNKRTFGSSCADIEHTKNEVEK